MECPNCGRQNPESARFCSHCGTALTADARAASSAAAPAPLTPTDAARQPRRMQRTLATCATGCVSLLLFLCTLLIVALEVPNLVALGLSTIAAITPAAFYSLLVLSLDRYEREPRRTVLGAFGWGAMVAILFSFIINSLTGQLLFAQTGDQAASALTAIFVAPLVEETFKGLALLVLLVLFRDEFDNVLDGLVYGALVGLGFAMTENIVYFGREYIEGGAAGLTMLFIARAVLGGFGHALYTATTGAALGWARSQYGRGILRFIVPVIGWALAVFQHFLWNAGTIVIVVIMGEGASPLSVVLVATIFLTLPALLTLFVIWLVVSRRESIIVREQLAEEVPNGVLTRHEYDILSQIRLRRQAGWAAYRQGGLAMWALQQRFFQAAAELAFRKYHLSRGEALKGEQKQTPEDEYRAQLAAIRAKLTATAAANPAQPQG